MNQFDVKFKQFDGGLGRALEGNDHISGLVMKVASGADVFHTFYSIGEAETAGITATANPASHYQIEQYFAQQPQGVLHYLSTAGDVDDAVVSLQSFAEGNVKQMAVLDTADFATSTVSALQATATVLADAHTELVILYSADFTDTTIGALPTLTTMQAPNVSVVVGADESGRSALGACLGTVSLASVSQNIGAVKYFNVVRGTEYDVLGFATGEKYRGKTDAELNVLKSKGYIYLRKYPGFNGSFWSDSNTATASTSDFSTIENNRTIQKAKRVLRTVVLPELGGPLKSKKGILDQLTIAKFENICINQLDAMVNADELETFKVVINPAQNVLATSELNIQIGLTPLGVARLIVIGIGFAV
jgi:Protein of unknown function (DUF2586)